jgi:hypothetical protein
MMPDRTIERWKKYLRYDPTRWLLETNDPSILLGVQLDLAHRPEDAPGVIETRERVLYSDPVQKIFAAQNEMGFWGDPENLARPYYTATLWNLALLAELGIPRASRRARNACEFILQNFLGEDGTVEGLNLVESGYLVHALGYFNYANDARVRRAGEGLLANAARAEAGDGERIAALWGTENLTLGGGDYTPRDAILDLIYIALGERREFASPAFPQFDPDDPVFILRVLTNTEFAGDPCVSHVVDLLVGKQNERAQWTLERDWNSQLVTPFERAGEPSRWLTLNALRVITRLAMVRQDMS